MTVSKTNLFMFAFLCSLCKLPAQEFYFGADLSYVNEMEDCGVIYKENNAAKDPFQIFAAHNNNLVRLRLWHTPNWYDSLNSGKRYSDFQDIKKSIARSKASGMQVLLDFHLSDNWADPGKQLVPAAWLSIVGNLPLLKDSVYNYITSTLLKLNDEGLLPEMVQIGNETNKGIILSPADNAQPWVLDWNRNSQLFNIAIKAVRDVETATGKAIKVAIHIAGPADAGWLAEGFWTHGVTDFDIIGLSYYWAWHKPMSIEETGNIIADLKEKYPGKQVMIFETGYLWTFDSNDNANNIIAEVHPNYQPPSPENQKKWLIDMTQKVIDSGGSGVIYWEPAWVSSTCFTQWGQGSHQEHAAYFDFNSNLLTGGGMDFMTHNYANLDAIPVVQMPGEFKIFPGKGHKSLVLDWGHFKVDSTLLISVSDAKGETVLSKKIQPGEVRQGRFHLDLPSVSAGIYFVEVRHGNALVGSGKVWLSQH